MAQTHGQGAGLMTLNLDPPYAVPNLRVVSHHLKDTPLRLSNLRAPGKIANVFAVESFTDELAAAAGMDPVAFRLRGLTDPRAIEVLKRAAGMMDWQTRPSPNPHAAKASARRPRHRIHALQAGRKLCRDRHGVAVDKATGKITVRRVVCAHDCGLVVNPDGLRNQVEGNIMQTLSRTLHEEVTFDRSRVTSVDWVSYPILTFPEAPAVQVALIDRPDQPSYGAGEAAQRSGGRGVGQRGFRCDGSQAAHRALHRRASEGGSGKREGLRALLRWPGEPAVQLQPLFDPVQVVIRAAALLSEAVLAGLEYVQFGGQPGFSPRAEQSRSTPGIRLSGRPPRPR